MNMKKNNNIKTLLLASISIVTFQICSYSVYLKLGSELSYETISHKLDDGWIVEEEKMDKVFISTTTETKNSWNTSGGAILLLNFLVKPVNNLSIFSEFKFINNYADRYWFTINDEHRMYLNNEFFKWTKAEVKYQITGFNIRYFKGIGHYHWGNEGDLFNLYPEQYEEQKYLRVSGRTIPEGFEINANGKFGKITLVGGEEVVWGYKNNFLLKYNFKILGFENTFIHKYEKIPFYNDYVLNTDEFTTKFSIFPKTKAHIGILYRPFRIGESYTYVNEVEEGQGVLGTKYDVKTDKTTTIDAISTKFVINSSLIKPYIDNVNITYTYAGLVAGDKNEIELQLSKMLGKKVSFNIGYLYRKPIIGPSPLLYEGTEENKGPIIVSPRGPESPFVVNWDNREASIFSFVFNFDPTPQTWFYKYQPNIVEDWNINPNEDAKFACAFKYSLEYYPTATDRLYFYDKDGNIVWEDAYSAGCWATKTPLNNFRIISRFNLLGIGLVINLFTGESLATGGVSYTTSTEFSKPITGYLGYSLMLLKNKLSFEFSYVKNYWGPEDWHRTFGQVIDDLYKLNLGYSIFNTFFINLNYISVKETDNKYISKLGSYDEIKLTTTIKFQKGFSFTTK